MFTCRIEDVVGFARFAGTAEQARKMLIRLRRGARISGQPLNITLGRPSHHVGLFCSLAKEATKAIKGEAFKLKDLWPRIVGCIVPPALQGTNMRVAKHPTSCLVPSVQEDVVTILTAIPH